MNSDFIYNQLISNQSKLHHIKRYINFINKCLDKNKNLSDDIYTETHHILPKSLFPEYKNLKHNPWNGIKLTYRQHYIAHFILAKIYGKGMWLAFYFMILKSEEKISSRLFEINKINYKNYIIEKNKNPEQRKKISKSISGNKNHFYGKSHTKETKQLISLKNKGRLLGNKNPMFGKKGNKCPSYGLKRSKETKKK